jgi:alpha-mannosidase
MTIADDEYYKNLDKLIHYVNKDGRVNAFYSTPSIYTEAKNKQNRSWSLKTDGKLHVATSYKLGENG